MKKIFCVAVVLMSVIFFSTLADAATLQAECDEEGNYLRQKIDEAASGDIILISAPECDITLGNIGEEDYNKAGDLDINKNLTIKGVSGKTVIKGIGEGRVFDIISGNVTLENLTIKNGFAQQGGGIYVHEGATLTVVNSSITDNTVSIRGGGISSSGALTIKDSIITGNKAVEQDGGGISSDGSTLEISDSLISGNTAHNLGGGIYSYSTTATIKNSSINANKSMDGGGIYNHTGKLELSGSTVSENETTSIGFSSGAGLYNRDTLTISNSTISGNVIDALDFNGSAIANEGVLEVFNSTISLNKGGSTIYSSGNGVSSSIKDTIVAGNSLSESAFADCWGVLISQGYNLIGVAGDNCTFSKVYSDQVGAWDAPLDPGLGSFTDTGKPGGGYFPLLDDSIAINGAVDCPDTDQLGNKRGGICDIGAVESTSGCGDGVQQPQFGETCDDGNTSNTDDCLNTCKPAACEDGVKHASLEECDESDFGGQTCGGLGFKAGLGSLSCTIQCKIVTSACVISFCSDGIKDFDEGCDDGNADETDACLSTCVSATCGDGKVQASVETCDNGASNSDTTADACRTKCIKAYCGDGVKDSGEDCDGGDNCTAECKIEETTTATSTTAICGNGSKEGDEECDDGNTADGDGCSSVCKDEITTPASTKEPPPAETPPAAPASGGGCSLIR